MSFLDIQGIHKRFATTQVLSDIHISVDEGEFLVLVGPSGCGKSTLLNTIAGLESINEGRICINGQDVTDMAPADRNIAMVFQSYALYPNMTVEKNITFALEMRKVPAAQRREACKRVAQTLQITHLLDRKPAHLSGGQRQRVAMGRALVRDPLVFLFDEPLSNLDAKLRVDMRTEIKQLHQSLKRTIVYVTHDQIEAMTLADRIAVMHSGVIRQLGTPHDIYHRPCDLFVASFMGSPAMNFLKGEVITQHDKQVVMIENNDDPTPLVLTGKSVPLGPVILGIRPEHILENSGLENPSTKTENLCALKTTVRLLEPSGADTFVIANMGETQITARMRGDLVVQPGQNIVFYLDTTRIHLFDPKSEKRHDT